MVVGRPRGELRPDIQALRAVAVGSVLLFHLWPLRLPGGYVGVDVFFVISGFLITSHLLREIGQTGTVHVGRFWARRAKRLLPAALTVLAVIAIAVVAFVPEVRWRQFLGEVVASALYAENWVLAADSVDYHASDNAPSPTQHFWTLSVEEQFYIILPILLVVVVLAIRGPSARLRRAIGVVLAVLTVASLAYSIALTAADPTVAYFSTFTRGWEFGAGALLAFVTLEAGRRARQFLPLIGIALIALSCILFASDTPFPGFLAAVPVLGAILVLWAGRESVVARAGSWWPVATLGHISYAVYLWHWPLIVLVPYATGAPLSTTDKVLILVASLGLAWASTRFIEEPVRFSPRLLGGRRRSATVAAWSALGMAGVVALCVTNLVVLEDRDQRRTQLISAVVADPPDCLGAAAVDPDLQPCENPDLAGLLVPDPTIADQDDDNRPECWGMANPREPMMCTVAEPAGYTKRLLAVGDSHNNQLIAAYRAIGEAQGWRIDVAGTAGCYLTTAEQAAISERHRNGCLQWRESVADRILADPPDALVVTHSSGDNIVVPPPGETVESATVDGLVEAWSSLPEVPIIAIRDNPGMTSGTIECVAEHGLRAGELCSRPRAEALEHFDGQAEAAELVPNATVIDLTELYCTDAVCSPVIGNVLVFRDSRHITSTWARTLTPYLEREMIDIVG